MKFELDVEKNKYGLFNICLTYRTPDKVGHSFGSLMQEKENVSPQIAYLFGKMFKVTPNMTQEEANTHYISHYSDGT
jgi:hypothetical protein